jgi:hypothetical protein
MNRVLAIFVGAVVLLAVLAGVVVANRASPDLNPGTPEGVVQEYLKAVFAGDYPVAAGLLSPSAGCNPSDLAAGYLPASARIVLDHSAVNGDHAVVTVNVTEGTGGGPFDSGGYSHTERIIVQRESGIWKISGSPWLLPSCVSTKG